MPEQEVCSPVSRPGSKVGSGQPMSPGARSPFRASKAARPDVPIIMITAYGDPETKRQALAEGAEALLIKPIDFKTLRSEIDMRVERAA